MRILVLEDDDGLREVLVDALTGEGYQAEGASSGEEALGLARSQDYDLVVADIRMGGMDGLEVLEHLKSEQPLVRSLVVTGYSTEADSIRAVRLGVGDYLKKPFDMREFLAAVRRLSVKRSVDVRREERDQSMRRIALACLRALACSVDANLLRSCELAGRLAQVLEIPDEQGDELMLSVLLECLREQPEARRWGDELPRPPALEAPRSQIARLALLAAELDPALAREELRQSQAFEPWLLDALDRALTVRTPSGDNQGRRRRNLLSLAGVLAGAGDSAAARAACLQVAGGGPTREGVSALLQLARVERSPELASQAVAMARLLGPTVAARALLDGGSLLGGHGPAAEWLGEAARLFGEVGMQDCQAQARLAMMMTPDPPPGTLLEQSLELLMRPEQADLWADSAAWLVPALLERAGRDPQAAYLRALRHLADEHPQQFERCVTRDELSTSARLQAVGVLSGHPQGTAALGALSRDPDSAVAAAARIAMAGGREEPTLPSLRVYSLGAFSVSLGEAVLDDSAWKTSKIKFLLAYLAAHRERFLSEDHLVETFWPGDATRGRANLSHALSQLRRVLRLPGGEAAPVVRHQGRLEISPEWPFWHDLQQFEQAVAEARGLEKADRKDEAMDRARRGVRLYRGPYLEGCYHDWALEIRSRVETTVATLLLALSGMCLQRQQAGEALEHAQRVLEFDPCHQNGHLLAMQAHLALKRPEEAVRQFELCRRLLRTELQMEPSLALLEWHQRALLSLP